MLRVLPHAGPMYGGPQQFEAQQGGPPPGPAPHQLAYGMVHQPGPAQPPTPGPQPPAPGAGLVYPIPGATGGPGPGGPTNMYLTVSAASQMQAHYAMLQQQAAQQQVQQAGGPGGPMTSSVVTSVAIGPNQQPYYIHSQGPHPGQHYHGESRSLLHSSPLELIVRSGE